MLGFLKKRLYKPFEVCIHIAEIHVRGICYHHMVALAEHKPLFDDSQKQLTCILVYEVILGIGLVDSSLQINQLIFRKDWCSQRSKGIRRSSKLVYLSQFLLGGPSV